jgi:enamine deaminase RidA (YjgF/YER057c/UK114 family)
VFKDGTEVGGGYSRAVRVGGQVHVSGTTARRADGSLPEGVAAQTAESYAKIEAALAGVGAGMADVVRVVAYVTDIGEAEAFLRAHRAAMGGNEPASTLVEVSRLVHPEMLVEIEAYAVIEPG